MTYPTLHVPVSLYLAALTGYVVSAFLADHLPQQDKNTNTRKSKQAQAVLQCLNYLIALITNRSLKNL